MQSLIIILQLLDILALVLEMFWLLVASHDVLWHHGNPL